LIGAVFCAGKKARAVEKRWDLLNTCQTKQLQEPGFTGTLSGLVISGRGAEIMARPRLNGKTAPTAKFGPGRTDRFSMPGRWFWLMKSEN